MKKDTIKACILILAAMTLWGAAELWAEVAGPKPEHGYANLVATTQREFASPRVHQRAVHAIEDLVTQNGFFLSGGFAPSQVIDGWELADLRFTHREHGTEILVSTIRKAIALDVFVFDRLHKGAWLDIKDKIETTMQRIQ